MRVGRPISAFGGHTPRSAWGKPLGFARGYRGQAFATLREGSDGLRSKMVVAQTRGVARDD
jgi:hypothetical protein